MSKDLRECFRALGLQPGASLEEIKSAYRQLLQRWHPDHYKPGSLMQTTAEDVTKEINEAYHQLCKKKRYLEFRPKTPAAESPPERKPVPKPEPWPDPVERAEKVRRAYGAPAPEMPEPDRKKHSRTQPPSNQSVATARLSAVLTRCGSALRSLAPRAAVLTVVGAVIFIGAKIWNTEPAASPSAQQGIKPVQAAKRPPPESEASLSDSSPSRSSAKRELADQTTGRGQAVPPSSAIPPSEGLPEKLAAARGLEFHFDAYSRLATAISAPPPRLSIALPPTASPSQHSLPLHFAAGARLEPSRLLDEALGLLATFNLGDSREKVLAVQGPPDQAGDEVIRYGSSLVHFRDGRVIRWHDGRPSLRVFALPNFEFGGLATFGVGSTKTEVAKIQGPPSAVIGNAFYYGASVVYFDREWVTGWTEIDQRLKARSIPNLQLGNWPPLSSR